MSPSAYVGPKGAQKNDPALCCPIKKEQIQSLSPCQDVSLSHTKGSTTCVLQARKEKETLQAMGWAGVLSLLSLRGWRTGKGGDTTWSDSQSVLQNRFNNYSLSLIKPEVSICNITEEVSMKPSRAMPPPSV